MLLTPAAAPTNHAITGKQAPCTTAATAPSSSADHSGAFSRSSCQSLIGCTSCTHTDSQACSRLTASPPHRHIYYLNNITF